MIAVSAWRSGLPGFGCFTPTLERLERETSDGRDKPATPPHDRGHDGPQSIAGDSAILHSCRCQVRALFRSLGAVADVVEIGGGVISEWFNDS